jgi:site-specific recombinase XerD
MLDTHITRYLEYLEIEKGRSPHTVRNYDMYLRTFLGFCQKQLAGQKPTAGQITLPLVQKYRVWLNRRTTMAGDPLKASTNNYYVIALRSFLKYLHKNDIQTLAPEKIELARQVRPQVAVLNTEKLATMLRSPDLETPEGRRDRAVMEVLFSTGLRVAELIRLDRNKVNTERGEFVIRGKGNKDRLVFLSPEAARHLRNYLTRREDSFSPVFLNHHELPDPADIHGEKLRLTARTIQRIIRRHARRAGIVEKVTPHTFRHTFATDLLSNGADLRSVQEMLGHASIQTTQVYTHVSNPRLREVHARFHGRSKSD